MVVGIWYGGSKPVLNEYIAPFVAELEDKLMNGIRIGSHHVKINFGLVICDTPARSMMKGKLYSLLRKIQSNSKILYIRKFL